jgi:site-specific DNA recombinase
MSYNSNSSEYLRDTFNRIASGGFLGDTLGKLAYGYARVSSDEQAEEGRSGLPRQLQHISDAAREKGLSIPWEMMYMDDFTGFEMDRPEFTKLRREYQSAKRKSNHLVMEHIDRMSRNVDWHQGFLLDEMNKCGMTVVFWKTFSSRIERVVMGAISQDGMEDAKKRMSEGNLHKARDGRVTARVAAYGYVIVDRYGNTGISARRDSHYALNPDEAPIVEYIFKRVALDGITMRGLAAELEGKYPPPKLFKNWEPKMIAIIIKNSAYKGDFIAHRYMEVKVPANPKGASSLIDMKKLVARKIERPPEEWIHVQVPPIVSTELWEAANRVLEKNKDMGRRNAKNPFLLTGLIECATCGSSFVGGRKVYTKRGKTYNLTNYRCGAKNHRMPVISKAIGCNQRQVSCRIIDNAVWEVVAQVLLNPSILIDSLDREYMSESNQEITTQIEWLRSQISDVDRDDGLLYKAYMVGVFDENEYKEKRKSLKERTASYVEEIEKLKKRMLTEEALEEKKLLVMLMAAHAKAKGVTPDLPFDQKQALIKTVVDRIVLNANENTFKIIGIVNGNWHYGEKDNENDDIMSSSAGRGSSRQSIGKQPGR